VSSQEGAPAPRIFHFGAFEADAEAGELRKAGLKVKLQQQPYQVLLKLLENSGEVVTREELRNYLWGSETFVDFEHGLNRAVNRVREALGDSADHPRYVETLPGRGYRFIAPVQPLGRPGVRIPVPIL
jgi:DNA-binding winged helix-turn-helix (wHTH) protein